MGIVSARRRLARLLLTTLVLALVLLPDLASAQKQKQVLVLYATRRDAQIAVVGDREIPRLLEHGLRDEVDYYSEFLDPTRFADSEYRKALRVFLGTKYQGRSFDLILAVGDLPLEFLTDNRQGSSSPIVYFSEGLARDRKIPNATGLIADLNLRGTLDFALQLHPDLKHVFVVSGAEPNGILRRTAEAQFQPLASRVDITYLAALSSKELESRLASLPAHSIVYYLAVERDGANQYFNPLEYLDRIAAIANAPIYSWVDSTIDHGVVGGSLKSQKAQMEALAALALRVLKGERADSIPVETRDLNIKQVDWRQVQRWHISDARIPAETAILFRQPSAFEQYRNYILGTIVLIGLQTSLIAGLVIQKRRRRRAEEALRESEQHFRMTADTAPVMIWRDNIHKHCDFVNRRWLDFRGRTLQQELGLGWTEGLHPDDRDGVASSYSAAFDRRAALQQEYRLRRADGEYRWVLATGVPRLVDGVFNGFIGSAIDITERKEAEETLRANEAKLRVNHAQIQDLAGRLITAQEEERSRIAREIHDDVSQQLAVLTMELELLRRSEPKQTKKLAAEVLTRAHNIARTLHDLSHRLHPARLRLLGLTDSLDALREELSQHGIPIAFTYDNIPQAIPSDLRLCVFRVVQEGLQNAIRHSLARHISVDVHGESNAITLSIVDDGVGFDVDGAWRKGLGLISMSERLEAFDGSLAIHSVRGSGTRLDITIPMVHVDTHVTIA